MASFSVVSNIASNNAQANLYGTQVGLQKALTRLSSGFRINVSGDDAAGLAVANTYRSDIAVITQGIRNANDGLSVLQVKDGALANITTLIDRLSTLATQAASAGTSGVAVGTLQSEANSILGEIERELNVAKMKDAKDFGVFISNDGSFTETTTTTSAVSSGNVNVAADLSGVATFNLPTVGDEASATHTFVGVGHADRLAELKTAVDTKYGAANVTWANDDSYFTVAGTSTTTTTATKNAGEVTGSLNGISLEAAPSSPAADMIYLGIRNADGSFLDLSSASAAATAVSSLQTALGKIGEAQGTIGTLQNKLSFAISLAQSQQVNKRAAESRIRDANIAEESANMTRYNILTQSGIAALAQANQSTSSVLALLR